MLGKMKAVIVFCKDPADIEDMCDNVAIISEGRLLVFESADVITQKLDGNVSALLRVRGKGTDAEKIIEALKNIEQITDVRAGSINAVIFDIKIECSTRDGVSGAVSAAVEDLGAEIVSLKFTELKIGDLMEALSVQKEEE